MYYKNILTLISSAFIAISGLSADYCVDPSASQSFVYRDMQFTPGVNAFTTISAAVSAAPEGSRIYIKPGTYAETIDLTKDNVELLGAGAYCDGRATERPSAETIITATWNVKASGITINGFKFTGNGRVLAIAGTTENPMKDFSIIYNLVESSTVTRSTTTPVFRVGSFASKENAQLPENNNRNLRVTISHNTFKGDESHTASYVLACNLYGTTNIEDNRFTDGGAAIRIDNARGTINIRFNQFNKIGVRGRITDDTEGESCVNLRYLGLTGSTTVNVTNNTFTNCQGLAPSFDLVRLHQGPSTALQTALKTRVNFNYNVVKGKTGTASGSDYNYVLFGDAGSESVRTDVRFNRFDQSELCMGPIATPWIANAERYFASLTGYFDFSASAINGKDYLKFATGEKVQSYICPSSKVAQNFDIDHETGDIYFVTVQGTSTTSVSPLKVTRVFKNASGERATQSMTLNNASHGSTLSVARFDNHPWIIISGASEYTDHCVPLTSCFLRFVSGATADLSAGKTSFTHSGTSYEIKQFSNQWGRRSVHPSIDVDNRLFCEMSNGAKRRFAIYDLDDVFNNVNDAKVIKWVQITDGDGKFESTNSDYASVVEIDKGFHTWPHQGFTIQGDYIYEMEGVGKSVATAFTYKGNKVASVMNHCYNWRDDQHVFRRPMFPSEITSSTNGEPEGVHLRRDKTGRTNFMIGFVNTIVPLSQYGANILNYEPKHVTGTGAPYTIPTGTLTTNNTSVSLSTDADEVGKNLAVTSDKTSGQVNAVITGPDADCFSVVPVETDGLKTSHTFALTFKPSKVKKNYSATLRYTSPGATDVKVPLTGTYTGTLTGVEAIAADNIPQVCEPAYFDLNGRPVTNPGPGLYIRRDATGSYTKVLITASANSSL